MSILDTISDYIEKFIGMIDPYLKPIEKFMDKAYDKGWLMYAFIGIVVLLILTLW